MAVELHPEPGIVREQLERILRSPDFRAPEKQRNFLRFVVEETLAGRGSLLKGFTIAVQVYGRNEEFDPQVDPIVRVEAGRLRRSLERYYLTDGRNDTIRITIPKGRYIPHFLFGPTSSSESRAPVGDDQTVADTSIAVMPFADMTAGSEHEYFTDGLTEELTAELARYQDFQVIAAQSSLRYKGKVVDPRVAGAELGVRFLVSGSVRRARNTIKINAQLIDGSTGEQVWGDGYRRDNTPSELIDVQEDIAGRVVGVIGDHYGLIERRLSRESRKKAPHDLTSYEAVLRFYHYETELTPKAFQEAFSALKHATRIDPEYGLVFSMLGHLHADNHALGFCPIENPLDQALELARRGVALAPDNQFAWDALALTYFHLGDLERLVETIDRTLELNPNAPYIVGVAGWHLSLCGEWDRGLALLEKGMNLNPHHPNWFHLVPFMNHFRLGEYRQALMEANLFNYPTLPWDPLMKAAALTRLGKGEEASSAMADLLALVPDFGTTGREFIRGYVKVEDLVEELVKALREAGPPDLA